MVIDVFITTIGGRDDMLARVVEWWVRRVGSDHVSVVKGSTMPPRDFQRYRREFAEAQSRTPYYVLTDDDILPDEDAPILDGVAELHHHPKLAVASAWLHNEPLVKQDAAGPDLCAGVTTMLDVGGLRFVRRGAMTEWPPLDPAYAGGYDRTQCDWLRANGWQVGYLRAFKATHLGKFTTQTFAGVR